MFEKESKEYAIGLTYPKFQDSQIANMVLRDVEGTFQKGAEFGYNKGYHDAEEHYMNVIDGQHKLVDESKKEYFKRCMKCTGNTYQYGFKDGYNKANEWHYVKDGDLPSDTTALYSVLVYSWDFGLSHLYKRYGTYIPTVCEWNGEYFKALDRDAYTNARNIRSCYAWKEIILPELKESE